MLTPQQQSILDHVQANSGLTMIDAKAGAGKTTMLVEISKTLNPSSALYMAYNKSVATEASKKFPKSVHCCTTHSLAYKPTVIEHKLKLGTFTPRHVTEKMSYDLKEEIVYALKEFCLSSYTSISEFCTNTGYTDHVQSLLIKYASLMQTGKQECTHEYYLKYFHILLAEGSLVYPNFDLIMLDEAGDLNEVTLEIFKLLPATRKIMVGDPYQNIYSFNHTINCFEAMNGQGVSLPMSQSFRVSEAIAERVERFGRKYLNPDFTFSGIPITDTTIKSRAYIARTNAYLISHMFKLNESKIPYSLARSAKQIFELPLALCSLKPRGFISIPAYKHLQDDVDTYYAHPELAMEYKSLFGYLRNVHSDDKQLVNTINLIQRHTRAGIINCYEEARKHEKADQSLLLGTAHSMKGLEVDEVTLAEDMNESIADIVGLLSVQPETPLTKDQETELFLYYVACTRPRKALHNARYM